MYKLGNLLTEMKRRGITNADLQETINCKSETVIRNKMEGHTAFTVLEAMEIRASFFPELRLEYLFQDVPDEPKAG